VDGDDIIVAENLVKRFGELTAVDGMCLRVRKGEVFGFLGPNGAGKTTTIRMLTTIDRPTSGTVTINGYDASKNILEARGSIGIIQQQHSLDKDLSVRENIVHHGLMQNMSMKDIRSRMDELSEIMDLGPKMDVLVEKLSGGWKKRVAIVCALIHDPDILFMDEPTTGLDTQSRNLLWKMIKNINRRGTTIFLTTHYIFEAESLCDRVAIIDAGKKIIEGTPQELMSVIGEVALVVTDDDGNVSISYHSSHSDAKQASLSVPEGYSINIRKSSLEDVFLEITGRRLRCTTSSERSSEWPTGTSASSRGTSFLCSSHRSSVRFCTLWLSDSA